jgi:hypothetical protein
MTEKRWKSISFFLRFTVFFFRTEKKKVSLVCLVEGATYAWLLDMEREWGRGEEGGRGEGGRRGAGGGKNLEVLHFGRTGGCGVEKKN